MPGERASRSLDQRPTNTQNYPDKNQRAIIYDSKQYLQRQLSEDAATNIKREKIQCRTKRATTTTPYL